MHDRTVKILSEGLVDLGLLPGTAQEVVEKGWYRQFFFHGTGHWLGIDVHDAGAYKVDSASRPLEAGMAFTVEPGIYVAPHKTTVTLSHVPYDPLEAVALSYQLGAAAARTQLARRAEESDSLDFEVPTEFVGLGARVEDDILMIEDGHVNLSSATPADPDEIEATCAEGSELPLFT
jgi:Xaa-Pro aminopeptidase